MNIDRHTLSRPDARSLVVMIIGFAFLALAHSGCVNGTGNHQLPKTLVVGTVYSPTGFFILHDDTLGYDYDRFTEFARDKGIALKWKVAPNMETLISMLEHDSVQVLACEIPITAEYQEKVHSCGAVNETYQVLIQHTGDSLLNDVTQLVGKDIYVEKDSKYESRLRNLDSELGGGIKIHPITLDTLKTYDLVDLVSKRKIPLTIVDSDIAKLNQAYVDSIDISLKVSFSQRSSWAVSIDNKWLGDSIDFWTKTSNAQAYSKTSLKRYFELSKGGGMPLAKKASTVVIPKGAASPYDDLFKKYGRKAAIDWRLLCAISYVESGFDPEAVSWAGARGIMQIMPSTAQGHGLSLDRMNDPEESVRVAVECILKLDKRYLPKVENMSERVKFILASYNAGSGHILDAIELARKYDKDPEVWDGNVEEALNWKSESKYYNDPVCHFGYFKATETVNYVAKVVQRYFYYKNKFPDNHNKMMDKNEAKIMAQKAAQKAAKKDTAAEKSKIKEKRHHHHHIHKKHHKK